MKKETKVKGFSESLMGASKLLGQIAEGWRNKIIPPDDLKEVIDTVSKHRINICQSCPYHSKNHDRPLRPDAHCTKCGCTLSAKTKCLSCKCPLDIPLWEEIIPKPKKDD